MKRQREMVLLYTLENQRSRIRNTLTPYPFPSLLIGAPQPIVSRLDISVIEEPRVLLGVFWLEIFHFMGCGYYQFIGR